MTECRGGNVEFRGASVSKLVSSLLGEMDKSELDGRWFFIFEFCQRFRRAGGWIDVDDDDDNGDEDNEEAARAESELALLWWGWWVSFGRFGVSTSEISRLINIGDWDTVVFITLIDSLLLLSKSETKKETKTFITRHIMYVVLNRLPISHSIRHTLK